MRKRQQVSANLPCPRTKPSQSSLISKEANPHLFEFFAKHISRIPVSNVFAERQFNLSQLCLQSSMSKLSKQASITFVENILHSGKTNCTTEAAREVHEERMKTYANMLTLYLLQEARKKLNTIWKCENHGPLTAKDVQVYPKAWEARKLNSSTPSIIQSLKAEGRELELQWKASTRGHSGQLSLQNLEQLERYGVMDRNFQYMTDTKREPVLCAKSAKHCTVFEQWSSIHFGHAIPPNYPCKKNDHQLCKN